MGNNSKIIILLGIAFCLQMCKAPANLRDSKDNNTKKDIKLSDTIAEVASPSPYPRPKKKEVMDDINTSDPTKLPPPPLPPREDEIFKIVEQMPHFPGCEHLEGKDQEDARKKCSTIKINAFVEDNLIYPKEAKDSGIEGYTIIRFVVEKDGSLTFDPDAKITIFRDRGGGCAEEALRILKLMPNWIPGKQKGKTVRVEYILPIRFVLPE